MENDKPPQFPNYSPPPGLELADPRQQKPLTKMIKLMMKAPKTRDPFHTRRPHSRRGKKQHRFF